MLEKLFWSSSTILLFSGIIYNTSVETLYSDSFLMFDRKINFLKKINFDINRKLYSIDVFNSKINKSPLIDRIDLDSGKVYFTKQLFPDLIIKENNVDNLIFASELNVSELDICSSKENLKLIIPSEYLHKLSKKKDVLCPFDITNVKSKTEQEEKKEPIKKYYLF